MSLPDATSVAAQLAAFEQELATASSLRDAQAVRDRFLGRKNSVVAAWMQLIASAPVDQKKFIGRYANELKQRIEARWATYEEAAKATASPAGAVDVTLPGRSPRLGRRHPLTVVRDRMESIFTRMGFAIVEGPEIEDEWHCFDALNMPGEHPARDMQDTLYLGTPVRGESGQPGDLRTMLRTHTSSIQIRYMQAHQPPIRIVAPGRVYRRDDLDLTHTPMFTQMEGLVVGEGISLADLKGHAARLRARDVLRLVARALPPELLPVYRAERRGRHQLLAVRRHRVPDVQAHRLGGDRRLRHGASGRVRVGRTSTRSASPALPSASASSASPSFVIRCRTSACSSRTTCGSSNSSRTSLEPS